MDINWNVEIIHSLYLPYAPQQFGVCHFLGKGQGPKRGLAQVRQYYLRSAQRYDRFLQEVGGEEHGRYGLSLTKDLRLDYCQIEKDEKFWLAGPLLRCFYSSDRRKRFATLLGLCEHAEPPTIPTSWAECMAGESDKIYLFFEAALPSPAKYRKWLQGHLVQRQFVPYVLYAAHRPPNTQGNERHRGDHEG